MRQSPGGLHTDAMKYRLAQWFLVLLLGAQVSAVGALDSDLEYRVKAAFLYNFARFIEWPATYGAAASDIEVCVFGKSPFTAALETALAGKQVNGRNLQPLTVNTGSEADNCEILYLPEDVNEREIQNVVSRAEGQPILTVGEGYQFNRSGGIVRFLLEDGKVRFEVNLSSAEKSGLKISSKLLRVAKTIEGSGPSG